MEPVLSLTVLLRGMWSAMSRLSVDIHEDISDLRGRDWLGLSLARLKGEGLRLLGPRFDEDWLVSDLRSDDEPRFRCGPLLGEECRLSRL